METILTNAVFFAFGVWVLMLAAICIYVDIEGKEIDAELDKIDRENRELEKKLEKWQIYSKEKR